MLGRCAAAAADDCCARFNYIAHNVGKFIRSYAENGFAVNALGQTRIGINYYGNACTAGEKGNDITHLLWPERAVHTDCVNAEPFKHCNHGGRVGSRHQLFAFVINAGNKNGQITAFLSRNNSRLCLVAVVHRFNQNKVCARLCSDFNALGKNFNSGFKRHIAERFKHFAERTDIKSNICVKALARRFCVVDSGGYYFREIIELQAVCSEGV